MLSAAKSQYVRLALSVATALQASQSYSFAGWVHFDKVSMVVRGGVPDEKD